MKLVVTGGAGFIGSNFVRHVLREHPDDRVVNLDRLTYAGNPANLADIARDPRYTFVQGDICDATLVRDVLRGADAVVNFAAESHVDRALVERDGPAAPVESIFGVQGRRRPAGAVVLAHARRAGRDHTLVEQLRSVPVSREGGAVVHHQRAGRPTAA